MVLYTKSASFSSTELNSESSLNVTDLVVNDNLQSINLISSLVLSYNSPNSVTFTFFDGFTDIGSANFNVTLDTFNTNATDFTVSSSSTYNLYDIVYGNGKYVVAIYNNTKYAYSTDGENFSLSTVHSSWIFSDTVYPMSIIYGNNLFILHSGRYVYHSSNGTSWTRTSLPNGKNNYRASYSLYGNGVFVLTLINQNYMYYSTNGTSWTAVSSSSKTYTGAAYGAGKFVYITSSGETIYSSNGSSWSTGSIGSGSNWNTLCYGNDKFVAISTDGSVAISTNGTSWTYYSGKLTAKTWISVDYGNNMFVAIAQSSNVLAVSFDGITWYETTIESTSRSWMKIRYTNNIFWGLAASNSSGKKFNPELLFKLNPTENTISNTHTIENSTLSLTHSEIPTIKSGSLDTTFTLENNRVATLTQKYYINGTTTSIKDDDVTIIDKGSSWSFTEYPSEITYNGDKYIFSSITGDNASGTNLDSNKERIIYYVRYEGPIIAGSGNVEFPLSIPMMSCLYNDMNMCYIKKYLVDYTTLNENTNINLGNLVNSHKIYKIKVIYKNTVDTLIEFNIADIKFIVNGTFTIGSVNTNITIINNCVILTHSNTTMSSGSIEIHLYCKP